MTEKKDLEIYYSGDDDWNEWVDMCKKDFWTNSEYQNTLLQKLNEKLDLAVVIYGRLEKESIDWIDKKVPALGYLTPLECLKSKNLILRLRECLMRMH